jgi:agmatine deiminase
MTYSAGIATFAWINSKKMKFKWLGILPLFIFSDVMFAQDQLGTEPEKLTHWLTPGEKLRLNEIGRGFQETPPPVAPVRNVAEFDQVQGALIRYPFGIPYTAIKEMAKNLTVTTIVSGTTQQNTVLQNYVSNGVDTSHCNFLIAPTNTYWTRDYGPWFESDTNNQIGIVDFPYNRPRPADDEIPKKVADMLGIPWYGMYLVATGGNYMTDGMGISASTTLIYDENPTLTNDQVAQKVHDYLGVDTYYLREDLNPPEYIEHIDCWGKFLAPDKILLKKVNPSHPNYTLIENEAAFWASQISSYGYPFRVFRVRTPNDQPYTNSVILNNKVLVPFMNTSWDDSAKAVYQNAMPGYEIYGFTALSAEPWVSTDAIHCRVMGIADVGLLYIRHVPLSGDQPCETDYQINADIIACSQQPLKTDSILIYYSVNNGPFVTAAMSNTSSNHYSGIIPKQPAGSGVRYYLFAADESDRRASSPFIGPSDPFHFTTVYTNLSTVPDTLWFLTTDDAMNGKITQITNFTAGNISLDFVQQQGDVWPWYVDSMSVSSLPYVIASGDSVAVRVKLILPLNQGELTQYYIDTLDILSANGPLQAIIMINKDLMTNVEENLQTVFLGVNYPNPVKELTIIPVTTSVQGMIDLDIFDIRGAWITNLASGVYPSGAHAFTWDVRDSDGNKVLPGIYFYRLASENKVETKRMVVIR